MAGLDPSPDCPVAHDAAGSYDLGSDAAAPPPAEGLGLKVWRLHPDGCRIVPADRSLMGTAHPGATRYCGPFTHANKAGWWVSSPVDIDITWHGGTEFEHELLTPYSNADLRLINFLIDEADGVSQRNWLSPEGRTKFTWGEVQPGVVQIWTGCVFQTPPGWGLQIRSPINCAPRGYHIMEAMLETDWLHYDIWMNLVFHNEGDRVSLRRDQWPPIAQLVPVRRESYETKWTIEEELVNRKTDEANRVFEYYIQYNEKKFSRGGRQRRSSEDPTVMKDSTTYYRERRRLADRTASE